MMTNDFNVRATSGRSGYTLIELAIAGIVLSVALLSFAAVLISAKNLDRLTAQKMIAVNVTRYVSEELANLTNIVDFQYVDDFLVGGWCFEVDGLGAPDPAKPFADGTYPTHYSSMPLDDYVGFEVIGTPPDDPDPYMDTTLDGKPIGLVASADPSTGAYGCVTFDPADANLYEVTVTIEWLAISGNQKLQMTSYLIRDVEDRVPTVP